MTTDAGAATAEGDRVPVRLLGYPLAVAERASEHYEEVVREFALLVSTGSAGPGSVPEQVTTLVRELDLRRARNAELEAERLEGLARGETARDLVLVVPPSVVEISRTLDGLLDQVDDFCRDGRVLTLLADDEVIAFRRWYLDQLVAQVAGAVPSAWPGPPV